jgi:hypothetical protein
MTTETDGSDDLYSWLGLDPAKPTRAISMRAWGREGLQTGDGRGGYGRRLRQFAEVDDDLKISLAARAFAYSVLSDPSFRAEYDAEIGLRENDVAARIAARSRWGIQWAWGFFWLAWIVGGFPLVTALPLGAALAPGFEFHSHDTHQGETDGGLSYSFCSNGVVGLFDCNEITSTSPAWNRALHSFWLMGAVPFATCMLVGWGPRRRLNALGSRFVARARGRGEADTKARVAVWSVALGVPYTLLASALVLAVIGS